MKNYQITLAEKIYTECWDEVYYESMLIYKDSDWTSYNTVNQINSFFKNNISRKKAGKGFQYRFQINNIYDLDMFEQIIMDCKYYARLHLAESLTGNDDHYAPSVHKKHLEILEEKYKEICVIRKEYKERRLI